MYRVRMTSPVDTGYHHLSKPMPLEMARDAARDAQLNNPHWMVVVEIVVA